MKTLVLQATVLIAIFVTGWLLLAQVNWLGLLPWTSDDVRVLSEENEKKLGDALWEMMEKTEVVVRDSLALKPVDSLLQRICERNGIDAQGVQLHLIMREEVNAFAMPGNHLVVHSGLILAADDETELAGVLSHELAHLQERHVSKKIIKELGISLLLAIVTGGDPGLINQAIQYLASTSYDRSLEREADNKAVDYLLNAAIDPMGFARFLETIAEEDEVAGQLPGWISTHPNPHERAAEVRSRLAGRRYDRQPVLAAGSWVLLQERLAR
jgi:predicted Zn-dependent protease